MRVHGCCQQFTCGRQEALGTTGGILWEKKAGIFRCEVGARVEEVVEAVLGDQKVNCPRSWKFCSCSFCLSRRERSTCTPEFLPEWKVLWVLVQRA